MNIDEVKGVIVFTGICGFLAFIIVGCMERKLKGVCRVLKQVEDDNKYVN